MTEAKTKVPMVLKRLAEMTKGLPGLEKNKQAPKEAGGFAYRGIDDLLDNLHPLLVSCKLILIPRILPSHSKLHILDGERKVRLAEVYVEYEFQSIEDGSSQIIGPVLGTGADNLDKMAGKAMTSAFKNAMYQAFCVAVGDSSIDPEVDSVAEEPPKRRARPAPNPDKDDKHRHDLHDIAVKLSQNDRDVYAGYIRDWTSYMAKDRDGNPVERYCTKASEKYPSGDFILQGTRLNIAIENARKSLKDYEEAQAAGGVTEEEQQQFDDMIGAAPSAGPGEIQPI